MVTLTTDQHIGITIVSFLILIAGAICYGLAAGQKGALLGTGTGLLIFGSIGVGFELIRCLLIKCNENDDEEKNGPAPKEVVVDGQPAPNAPSDAPKKTGTGGIGEAGKKTVELANVGLTIAQAIVG